MLLLWSLSFVLSVFTFVIGLIRRSSVLMLVSGVTFIPIAYYFFGANSSLKLVASLPILLFLLAFVFWKKEKLIIN